MLHYTKLHLSKKCFLTLFFTLSFLMLLFSLLPNSNASPIEQSKIIPVNTNSKTPNLVVSQVYEINDDYIGASYGDDDNLVDAGETIELRLELQNTGDEAVTNVFGNLTTSNPFVSLSSFNQSYLQINPGETALSISYYLLEFDSIFNVSDVITFSLEMTATEGTWFDTFQLTIMGIPEPSYYGYEVTNELNGDLNADNDGVIDPGENIQFTIYIVNNGDAIYFGDEGYISVSDPFIAITDDTGYYATIDGNGDTDYSYFGLSISGACPLGYSVIFNLSLVDDFGNFMNSSFELVVSGYPEFALEEITYVEYEGDEDLFMDAGEVWSIDVTIRNIGDAIASNTYVRLNSDEPLIDFYYSGRNLSFGDMYAGFAVSKVGSYDWRIIISDQASDNQFLDLYFTIYDETSLSTNIINITIQVTGTADYDLLNFSIVEDCYYTEDCDGLISAGESFGINITFLNSGEADGNGILILIYSDDNLVDFYYDEHYYIDHGSLGAGQSDWIYSNYYWDFTISEKAKAGHVINFTILITDNSLREWSFSKTIIVDDGPNTFYFTPTGKAFIYGGSIAFILFCVFPFIQSQLKKRGKPVSLNIGDWWEDKKDKIKDKREERNRIRSQKHLERQAVKQQEERERIARISANEKRMLEKFESILKMSDSVNIDDVAKSLGLKEAQLFELLIQWQEILPFKVDGDMIEVDDTVDFTKSVQETIAEMTKYYSCYHCGFPIERSGETCPDCKNAIDRCAVCKL
ncbi:MAG: hypothetical protein FK733_08120, partial [Asgard group archaeon]|nr:hypothetical protein [Asgard group archaeon]